MFKLLGPHASGTRLWERPRTIETYDSRESFGLSCKEQLRNSAI